MSTKSICVNLANCIYIVYIEIEIIMLFYETDNNQINFLSNNITPVQQKTSIYTHLMQWLFVADTK